MSQINKIDYFVGVFVSAILNSAKSVPALFEETNESKRVEFTTNLGEFNVYVKYSRKLKISGRRKPKEKTSWNVLFSNIEYEKLKSSRKDGYKNYVALVGTNDALTKTRIAVLDYVKALNCLREAAPTGSRRITVTRIGSAQEYRCKGVGFISDESESCFFDYTKYFEKAKSVK